MNTSKYTTKQIDRFWSRVDYGAAFYSECWNWTARTHHAYGEMKVNGKNRGAHRIAWEITYGDIPDGLCVCHKCDNPLCCNPHHLFLGTIAENNYDRHQKGRDAFVKGDSNGRAILTPDQIKEIRERYEYRSENNNTYVLAKEYGVHFSEIGRIVRNENWQDENYTPPENEPLKGEKHWMSKLTKEQVSEIREKYANGDTSHQKLAKEYGVSHGQIGRIVRGENWNE